MSLAEVKSTHPPITHFDEGGKGNNLGKEVKVPQQQQLKEGKKSQNNVILVVAVTC